MNICTHGISRGQGCLDCAVDFTNKTEEALDRYRMIDDKENDVDEIEEDDEDDDDDDWDYDDEDEDDDKDDE